MLFALWKSLFAAVDTLSTLSEDPEIQRLFEKRCEEITRIEVKIVSIRPQSLRELAMQAEVVRYYASQGDFDRDGVSQILANVIAYAA